MAKVHRKILNRLFRFEPTHATLIAMTAGAGVVLLSLLMLLAAGVAYTRLCTIVFRDILMVFILGFCFPLYYIYLDGHSLRSLGFTRARLKLSLKINIALSIIFFGFFCLLAPFALEFNVSMLYLAVYVLTLGIFETVFFFGFLRYYLEKAFGMVPAILLTAVFYSLHHVGFQPEIVKFFCVGVIYTSLFYLTRNIFIIFPCFWFVGAFWDFEGQYLAGTFIVDHEILIIALCQLAAMIIYGFFIYRKSRAKPVMNNLLSINAKGIQISSKNNNFHKI